MKLTAPNPVPLDERISRYLAKCPPAVSGQSGHAQTFYVACQLVNGFGLDEHTALAWLSRYSATCVPPWSQKELEHKIKSAVAASHDKPRGHLLAGNLGISDVEKPKLTPEQRAQIEAESAHRRLAAKARAGLATILEKFACGFAYYGNRSPFNLFETGDPRIDWQLLLRLFEPDDVVWIGTKKNDSANDTHPPEWIAKCKARFRPVREWLKESECPGILIVPNTFKPGVHSRSDENVLARRYLVIESDDLDKNQVCAVFKWTEQFAKLRAIVDTGGKSLHGWFEWPAPGVVAQLKEILPQLGCDDAMFTPSQPCRLPGGYRAETDRYQSLLYLDLEGME